MPAQFFGWAFFYGRWFSISPTRQDLRIFVNSLHLAGWLNSYWLLPYSKAKTKRLKIKSFCW